MKLKIGYCWIAISGCLIPALALAQVGQDVQKQVIDRDVTSLLLASEGWEAGQLPGVWTSVSSNSEVQSQELKSLAKVFGEVPQQVLAFQEGGKVVRLEMVYLEAGNFFGYRKSREVSYTAADPNLSEGERKRALEMLEKEEEEELKKRSVVFQERFDALASTLAAEIERYTGSPGKVTTVGSGSMLRTRARQYEASGMVIRLIAEDDQLVAIKVVPEELASRRMIASTVGRRSAVGDNVKSLENGDVVIENIPMFNQGSRGYCAIGTLAMITQYYGLNLNIDQLAAKAGYKEGDTDNATIIPIYQATAKEAKLRMREVSSFDFRDAMRSIDDGEPILVWRYFSRERDAVHTGFKQQFNQDPSAELPDPRRDKKEKENWPKFENGGHASLVTGFNKERGEILFTESWGEETRHRRMRAEEMEETCYVMFKFEL